MHCMLSVSQNIQRKLRLTTFSAHLTAVMRIQSVKNRPCKSKNKPANTNSAGGGQVFQSVTY
jgi:hypothetical protein